MQQSTLIQVLESIALPFLSAPWDKSGVQVASDRNELEHVALCLDPQPALLARALDAAASMIISHHPLAMKPAYPDILNTYHQALRLLFSHNTPLYSAHTSLDANPLGPVTWLAAELGMKNCQILEPTGHFNPVAVLERLQVVDDLPRLQLEHFAAAAFEPAGMLGGFGCVGDITPMPFEKLMRTVEGFIDLRCATVSGPVPRTVRRLAISPGSGASVLEPAAALGAEIILTGDIKYHTALDNQSSFCAGHRPHAVPFCIIDVGHFGLEEEMTRRLAHMLGCCMPELKVSFLPGLNPFTPLSLPEVPEVLA